MRRKVLLANFHLALFLSWLTSFCASAVARTSETGFTNHILQRATMAFLNQDVTTMEIELKALFEAECYYDALIENAAYSLIELAEASGLTLDSNRKNQTPELNALNFHLSRVSSPDSQLHQLIVSTTTIPNIDVKIDVFQGRGQSSIIPPESCTLRELNDAESFPQLFECIIILPGSLQPGLMTVHIHGFRRQKPIEFWTILLPSDLPNQPLSIAMPNRGTKAQLFEKLRQILATIPLEPNEFFSVALLTKSAARPIWSLSTSPDAPRPSNTALPRSPHLLPLLKPDSYILDIEIIHDRPLGKLAILRGRRMMSSFTITE